MSIALVQVAGSTGASQTFGAGGGTVTSSGNFVGPTTAGNFLVAICWGVFPASTGASINVTTSGVTWTSTGVLQRGSTTPVGLLNMFYCQNAPSVLAATSTVFTSHTNQSGTTSAEGTIYEFSGVLTSGTVVENTQSKNLQSNAVPFTTSLVTSLSDLAIIAYSGDIGSVTQGSGFTAGPNVATAQFGGSQYLLNTSANPTPDAFAGTSQVNWCARAAAFKPQPGGGGGFSGTSVNYGYIFG